MKEIQTILPYYVYKNLADSKQGFPGVQEFIDLLVPALKELEDDDIIIWIGRVQEIHVLISQSSKFNANHNAIEISIIREYVRRVELERQLEAEKQRLYAQFEEICKKEEWYKEFSKYDSQMALHAATQRKIHYYLNDIKTAALWDVQFNQHLSHLEALKIREQIREEKWFTGF